LLKAKTDVLADQARAQFSSAFWLLLLLIDRALAC